MNVYDDKLSNDLNKSMDDANWSAWSYVTSVVSGRPLTSAISRRQLLTKFNSLRNKPKEHLPSDIKSEVS